ncbi:MAG: signal peptidase I [Mobilicoccus sp.]|nr:signal peptidase I [Mobilicoccus sp.]
MTRSTPADDGAAEGGAAEGGSSSTSPSSLGRSLLVFVKEIVIIVALAVVLSLVLKTWLVQTFWIPSASMMSTLIRDDRVLVSKLTPGPFELSRGDIVVFEDPGGWLEPGIATPSQGGIGEGINTALTWVGLLPEDEGNHLIKRVIGMPGDHVVCCSADGKLEVNGTPIQENYLHPGDTPSDISFDITVPPERLWVMGDHRSDSVDSRFQPGEDLSQSGTVPIDNVVGRAFSIVWPLNRLTWLGEPEGTFEQVNPPPAITP